MTAALLVVLAIAAIQTPRVWLTGQMSKTGRRPGWWPYSEAGWLAWARVSPRPASLSCSAACRSSSTEPSKLSCSVSALWLPCIPIALFNRPRLFVPPPRRGDTGATRFRG